MGCSTLASNSLPASSFTVPVGADFVWMAPGNTLNDFFSIESYCVSGTQCVLRRGQSCDQQTGIDHTLSKTADGFISIDTTTSFNVNDACIYCWYNARYTTYQATTDSFSIQTTTSGCTGLSATLQSKSVPAATAFASGDSSFTIYQTPVQLGPFNTLEDTSGNCNIEGYELWYGTQDSINSGLSITESGDLLTITTSSGQAGSHGSNLSFRLMVKMTGGFYVIYDKSTNNGVSSWSFEDPCLSATLTAGTIPLSRTSTQWVEPGAATAFFALPEYTSDDTTDCSIQQYSLSLSSSSYSDHPSLQDVTSNAQVTLAAVPTNVNTEARYDFYMRIYARDSLQAYSQQFTLIVGCPSSEISISYDFGSNSYVQFVPFNDASLSKYTMPSFSTEEMTQCPIDALDLRTIADTTATISGITIEVTRSFAVPDDVGQEQQYTFKIFAQTSQITTFTPELSLVVGCPSSAVTITENGYPLGKTAEQFFILDGTTPQQFITPTFSSDKDAEGCSVSSVRVSSDGATYSPMATLNEPVDQTTHFIVEPAVTSTTPITFKFFIQASTSLRASAATLFSQEYTMVIGCDTTHALYQFTTPTLLAYSSVPTSDATTRYLFDTVTSSLPSCPVTEYIVSAAINSGVQHPELDSPVVFSSTQMKVVPSNDALNKLYTFYVGFKAPGMTTYQYLPNMVSLQVGCSDSVAITVGSSYSPSDDQYVPVSDKTFALPSFTTGEPNCKLVLKVTSDNTQLTPMTGVLEEPSVSSLCCYSVVASTAAEAQYSFYIQATTESGVQIYSQAFTLTVGCPTVFNSFSIIETRPSGETDTQLVQASDAGSPLTEFDFPSYATNAAGGYCVVETLEISFSLASLVPIPELTAPYLEGGTYKTKPTDISVDAYYEFYLFVHSTNGAVTWKSSKLTFVIGCPVEYPLTATATSTYPFSRSYTQYVRTGVSAAWFFIPEITPSLSYCSLDYSSFAFSSTSGSYTAISTLQPLQTYLSSYYYATPNDPTQDAYFAFYLRTAFANGQQPMVSQIFYLIIGCPVQLTSLIFSEGSFSGTYTMNQAVDRNDISHGTYYVLNSFTASISYCPPNTFKVSSSSSSLQEDLPLTVVKTGGEVRVVPDDISLTGAYTFYIHLQRAGTSSIMPTSREFRVGCLEAWVSSMTETQATWTNTIFIGSGIDTVANTYSLPTLASTTNTCAITQLTVVDHTNTIIKDPASGCQADPLCSSIKTTQISSKATQSYRFEIKVAHGSYTKLSPLITLEVDCNSASTTITFLAFPKQILNYGEPSHLYYDIPQCSVPSCCTSMTYEAYTSAGSGVTHPLRTAVNIFATDPSLIEIAFTTTSLINTTLVLSATNSYLTQAYSADLDVEVKFNCARDDDLKFSTTQPTDEEIDAIRGLGLYQVQDDDTFLLMLSFKVSQVQFLDIDIVSRFSNQALPGSCPMLDYRIEEVTDISGQLVPEPVWSRQLSISSQGVLSITSTTTAVVKYKVFVSVYNGAIWSDIKETGHLMELTITEEVIALPNVAPKFLELPKEMSVMIEAQSQGSSPSASKKEIALPEIYDANFDSFKIELLSSYEFLSIDSEAATILIDQSQISISKNLTVSIKLTDEKGASQDYELLLKLKMEQQEEEEAPEPSKDLEVEVEDKVTDDKEQEVTNLQSDQEEEVITKNVTAKIASIDKFGLITITFNATMASGLNVSELNSSNINMWIALPAEAESGSSPPAFHWMTKEFYEKELTFHLSFNQPLNVSRLAEQDTLHLEFSKQAQSLFFSPKQRKYLHDSSLLLKKKVPKQMPDTAATRSLESASSGAEAGMIYAMCISFALNLVMSGGMRYMLLLIRCLQIVLHIPLVRIIVPSNVSQLFKSLIPIATFDLLDPDWTTKLIFKFDENAQEEMQDDLLDQMVDLGYETHNSILNLGSLAIFTAFYFLQLGFIGIISVVRSKWPHSRYNFIEAWKVRLFYGDLIAILIDAYFEFLISGYLQIKQPLNTTDGEVSSTIFGVFSYLLILGFMNYGFAKLLLTPLEVIQKDPTFNQRWGQLHEGVKTKSKETLSYFPIFAGRRIAFLLLAFYTHHHIYQISGLIIMNMLVFMYIGHVKPLETRLQNKIELANEVFISIVTFNLMLFTDWVQDEETKFDYGWSMILIIGIVILYNMYFVLRAGLKSLYLIYLKYKNKRAARSMEAQKIKLAMDSIINGDEDQNETDDEEDDPQNQQPLHSLPQLEGADLYLKAEPKTAKLMDPFGASFDPSNLDRNSLHLHGLNLLNNNFSFGEEEAEVTRRRMPRTKSVVALHRKGSTLKSMATPTGFIDYLKHRHGGSPLDIAEGHPVEMEDLIKEQKKLEKSKKILAKTKKLRSQEVQPDLFKAKNALTGAGQKKKVVAEVAGAKKKSGSKPTQKAPIRPSSPTKAKKLPSPTPAQKPKPQYRTSKTPEPLLPPPSPAKKPSKKAEPRRARSPPPKSKSALEPSPPKSPRRPASPRRQSSPPAKSPRRSPSPLKTPVPQKPKPVSSRMPFSSSRRKKQ